MSAARPRESRSASAVPPPPTTSVELHDGEVTLRVGDDIYTHTLTVPQGEFVESPQHQAAFVGGIGSGKSYAGAIRALLAGLGTLGHTDADGVRLRTPNLGAVTAPTENMLRDTTLRTFREIAEPFIDHARSAFAPPIRVRLINDSEILFRSADNAESLRGTNLSWWWGDEAALYPASVWRIMLGRLRQFGQHGYAWITTTPKGRDWIWRKFVEANDERVMLVKSTTQQNKYLDPAFIAALEADYSGDFARQELGGEFVAREGLVYPEFDRERHIIAAEQIPEQFSRVIAGMDFGFQNPGVLLVVGVAADSQLIVLHEEYARQRGIEEWATLAAQLRDHWQIEALWCDPSGPENIRVLKEHGLRAFPADNTVMLGIQMVKQRLNRHPAQPPGLLLYPGATHTADEFEQYHWMQRGEQVHDQPAKAHDHCLDALRYAVMAVDRAERRVLTVEKRELM